MRERLIAAFVGLTIAVVALYGIPRAYIVAEQVQQNEERKIERSLDLLAVLLVERSSDAAPITEEFLSRLLNEAERIEYVAPDGASTIAAGALVSGETHDIVKSIPLENGGSVTLSRASDLIEQRIADAVLPVVLIGIALILGSVLLGLALARRLSRPFQDLARVADELGSGRFDVEVPHYRVPEAEEIAFALRSSTDALRELVRREHEFAANASHQLRTPVTALRLELEDLAMWPETPPVVAEELGRALRELDRLSETVTELLALARGQRLAAVASADLAAIVRDAEQRWAPAVKAERRRISVSTPDTPLPSLVPPGPVSQILDVLIENALRHGRGPIAVSAVDRGTHVELAVADRGPRPSDQGIFARATRGDASAGEGIGLAVAQELATALGGHLLLAEGEATTFTLLLAKPGDAGVGLGASAAQSPAL